MIEWKCFQFYVCNIKFFRLVVAPFSSWKIWFTHLLNKYTKYLKRFMLAVWMKSNECDLNKKKVNIWHKGIPRMFALSRLILVYHQKSRKSSDCVTIGLFLYILPVSITLLTNEKWKSCKYIRSIFFETCWIAHMFVCWYCFYLWR